MSWLILPPSNIITSPLAATKLNRTHPLARNIIQAWVRNGYFGGSTAPTVTGSTRFTDFGPGLVGGSTNYVSGGAQYSALTGRVSGGTTYTAEHTVVAVAKDVGNGYIVDDQASGTDGATFTISAGNAVANWTLGNFTGPSVPTKGLAVIAFYSGMLNISLPYIWVNGRIVTAANYSLIDNWVNPRYAVFFGSSAFPTSNTFVGNALAFYVFKGKLSESQLASLRENPFQVWEASETPNYILALKAASGGTVHDVAIVETAGMQDQVSTLLISSANGLETFTILDGHIAEAMLNAETAESYTLDETVYSNAVLEALSNEQTSVSDAQNVTGQLNGAQQESLTVGESSDTSGSASVEASESVNVTDVESGAIATESATTESVSTTESQASSAVLNSALTEQTTVADDSTSESSGISTVVENTVFADSLSSTSLLQATQSEQSTLAATESSVTQLNSDLSDAVTMTDSESADASNLQIATESIALIDTETASATLVTSIEEISGYSDAMSASLVAARSIAESLAISDTTNFLVTLVEASLTESFTATADATSIKLAVAELSEVFTATVAHGGGLTYDAVAAELLSLSTTENGVIAIFKIPAEVGVQFFVETLRTVVKISPELTVEVGSQTVSSVVDYNYVTVDVKNP